MKPAALTPAPADAAARHAVAPVICVAEEATATVGGMP